MQIILLQYRLLHNFILFFLKCVFARLKLSTILFNLFERYVILKLNRNKYFNQRTCLRLNNLKNIKYFKFL